MFNSKSQLIKKHPLLSSGFLSEYYNLKSDYSFSVI
jgi:hypothetical protein